MKFSRNEIFAVTLCIFGIAVAAYGVTVWRVNDVETPRYSAVMSDAECEIRDHPALLVADVVLSGDR